MGALGATPTFAVAPGGNQSVLNITGTGVVVAAPCVLVRVTVQQPGSGAALTINDASTTGGASASNQFLNVAASSLTSGQVIKLEWPIKNGIVISSMPAGAVISLSFQTPPP